MRKMRLEFVSEKMKIREATSRDGNIPLGIGQDDIYVIANDAGSSYNVGGINNYGGTASSHSSNYYDSADHEIWSTDAEGELLCASRRAAENQLDAPKHVFVDVFLPSGFLMPIQCPAFRTLAQLKQDVYIQAKRLPPSAHLSDTSDYIFSTIGLNGVRMELYDECKSVSALCITCLPVFELVQPEDNAEDKALTQKISTIIGFPLMEIERQLCEELSAFRLQLFDLCDRTAADRGTEGVRHYAFYHDSRIIPLAVKPVSAQDVGSDQREANENDIDCMEYPEDSDEILRRSSDRLRGRMELMNIYVEVWWRAQSPTDALEDAPFTHSVRHTDVFGRTSADLIVLTLNRLREMRDISVNEDASDFILQIAGQRVFIEDTDVELTEFRFIRSSLENYRIPHLLLRRRAAVFSQYIKPSPIFEPAFSRRRTQESRLKATSSFCEQKYHVQLSAYASKSAENGCTKSFWDLDENLRIRLHSLSKVAVGGEDKVFVRVAITAGRHLMDVQQTMLIEPTKARFMENGLLEFGMYVKDVPESAHFSFTLMCVRGAARATSAQALQRLGDGEPLGWANCRLFDWRRRLLKGKQTLSLWAFPKDLQQESFRARELNLHLSGAIHLPNIAYVVGSIEMEIDDYKDDRFITYEFPSTDTIFRFNNVLEERRMALLRDTAMNNFEVIERTGDTTNPKAPLPKHQKQQTETKLKQLQMEKNARKKSTVTTTKKKTSDVESEDSDLEEELDESGFRKGNELRRGDLPFTGLLTPDSREFSRLIRLHRCLDVTRLSAKDQRFLWRMRCKLRQLFPQLIVLLADCGLVWHDRERTCEFYALMRDWPALRVETAIELLDGRYTDARLRALAVQNLDTALSTDNELSLYLLTLVQAIRYEPYAYSPLVTMLLRRSILSYRIAHTVFWLLRAELAHLLSQTTATSSGKLSFLYLRYALMLEAICRANSAYLDSTIKQVEMVSQLTYLSTMIRNIGGNKDVATKKLQQELEARKESLQYMDSPLNPIDRLGELWIKDCRVLGSAKMPLRLTWRNPEPMASLTATFHQLIFKNGDDMRQDMLTIQVMRIMDSKWKSYNCEYCMTLYDVLPMGRNIGLIQVVQNCRTLFEIQCEAGPVASSLNMDTNMLHKFLYRNYDKSNNYMERVDRFSASLAGYCIATYVIGIRDRHQDNIMIADDGRIFHIDFGHFLGHTKRKLGINRERTDFILTEHFLSAISHCKDYRKSHEFATFRDECVKGFMIVYDHARFYITLFRMMLCMGLPELSAQENVDFLRDTLMYAETERAKVRDAFQATFDQAIRGDWSVSVNWFFHTVKHM